MIESHEILQTSNCSIVVNSRLGACYLSVYHLVNLVDTENIEHMDYFSQPFMSLELIRACGKPTMRPMRSF